MILLDTHVLVWLVLYPKKLSRAAASAIRRAEMGKGLAISAVSLLELVNLIAANRLDVIGSVERTLASLTQDVDIRPLTLEIAARSAYLPPDFPRDPADRAIAATASVEGIPLVTADERILKCPAIKTIW